MPNGAIQGICECGETAVFAPGNTGRARQSPPGAHPNGGNAPESKTELKMFPVTGSTVVPNGQPSEEVGFEPAVLTWTTVWLVVANAGLGFIRMIPPAPVSGG